MTEVHIKLENTEHQNPVVSRGEVVAVLVHVQAHALMLEILGASAFIWGNPICAGKGYFFKVVDFFCILYSPVCFLW